MVFERKIKQHKYDPIANIKRKQNVQIRKNKAGGIGESGESQKMEKNF